MGFNTGSELWFILLSGIVISLIEFSLDKRLFWEIVFVFIFILLGSIVFI